MNGQTTNCECGGQCKKCQAFQRGVDNAKGHFESEQQRKFMWWAHPDIAEDWAHGEHSAAKDHKMPEEPMENEAEMGAPILLPSATGKSTKVPKIKAAAAGSAEATSRIQAASRPEMNCNAEDFGGTDGGKQPETTVGGGPEKTKGMIGVKPLKIPVADPGLDTSGETQQDLDAKHKELAKNQWGDDDECECDGEDEDPKCEYECEELMGNAEGRGNWSLKNRADHAEGLTKSANDASARLVGDDDKDAEGAKNARAKELHEQAADAHMKAYLEASRASSTGADPDYTAAGYHQQMSKMHTDKAEQHATQQGARGDMDWDDFPDSTTGGTRGNDSTTNVTANGGPQTDAATSDAVHASIAHPPARGPALDAMDACQDGDCDGAAKAHVAAAKIHEKAATDARKDHDDDSALEHDNAAALHRKAASMHTAGVMNMRRPTRNAKAEGSYADVLHDASTESREGDKDDEEQGGRLPEEEGSEVEEHNFPGVGEGKSPKSNPLASKYEFPGGGPNASGGETAKGAFQGNHRRTNNQGRGRAMTDEQYLAMLPPRIRRIVTLSLNRDHRDRYQIVHNMVRHIEDPQVRNRLGNQLMALNLEDLAALQGGPTANYETHELGAPAGLSGQPHFMGAGAPVANQAAPNNAVEDDGPLVMPVLNMKEISDENARNNGRLLAAAQR